MRGPDPPVAQQHLDLAHFLRVEELLVQPAARRAELEEAAMAEDPNGELGGGVGEVDGGRDGDVGVERGVGRLTIA